MWASVGQVLEPGERVVAGAMAQTGVNMGWAALLGALLTALVTRYWYLVATDRRFIVLPASKKPKGIDWAEPLGQVSIQDHKVGKLWSVLELRRADGSTIKYRYLPRLWAQDMAQVVQQVSGAPQQGYEQPVQQPQAYQQPPQQGGFTA
jgi:hypothetical protein